MLTGEDNSVSLSPDGLDSTKDSAVAQGSGHDPDGVGRLAQRDCDRREAFGKRAPQGQWAGVALVGLPERESQTGRQQQT
jgi:hypothetical protein